MKARKPIALGLGLLLVPLAAGAQEYDDERTLADEIPDVEIPDVVIGGNDAVLYEEDAPPPVAVFEGDVFGPAPPTTDEAELSVEEIAVEESAPEGERVTGNVSAIDLEAGTLEVDTDTQGTLRLSADRARLRQVAPGQSVSLSYVDRDDGRWVDELEALPAPAPLTPVTPVAP